MNLQINMNMDNGAFESEFDKHVEILSIIKNFLRKTDFQYDESINLMDSNGNTVGIAIITVSE